jgi:hypothetical protein
MAARPEKSRSEGSLGPSSYFSDPTRSTTSASRRSAGCSPTPELYGQVNGEDCRGQASGGVYTDTLYGGEALLLRVTSSSSTPFDLTLTTQLTGPDRTVTGTAPRDLDLVDLDAALEALAQVKERYARIVELRYFAGLTIAEVAEVLGVSTTIVDREWAKARAWLAPKLEAAGEDPAAG